MDSVVTFRFNGYRFMTVLWRALLAGWLCLSMQGPSAHADEAALGVDMAALPLWRLPADPGWATQGWRRRTDLFPRAALAPDGAVPLMAETWFNADAVAHLSSPSFTTHTNDESVLQAAVAKPLQPLPQKALALMLGWWPIARDVPTPLPLWDPAMNTRPTGSNGYLHWPRLVAVDSGIGSSIDETIELAFAGRFRIAEQRVSLASLVHQPLDALHATRWMANPMAKKLSMMVLGRELEAGDFIALVAVHVLVGNGEAGVWTTLWWQGEQPDGAVIALGQEARHYRFDTTRDSHFPLEPDGSPNRCFNPWFEGGLPDTGMGNGLHSNCVSCHARAGRPAKDFLRVTRGDVPPAPKTVRTGLLWSPALAGRPVLD